MVQQPTGGTFRKLLSTIGTTNMEQKLEGRIESNIWKQVND